MQNGEASPVAGSLPVAGVILMCNWGTEAIHAIDWAPLATRNTLRCISASPFEGSDRALPCAPDTPTAPHRAELASSIVVRP